MKSRPTVQAMVLQKFRAFYRLDWPDQKILETEPNGFDRDPGPFYEDLQDLFGVDSDPDNSYFGGLGGTVRQTVAYIEKNWDGRTLTQRVSIPKNSPDEPAPARKSASVEVDCAGVPELPDGASYVLERQLPARVASRILWSRDAESSLYVSPLQKGDGVDGEALRKDLSKKAVLPSQAMDWFMANPEQIPESWKEFGACICFWGSIFKDANGAEFIRMMTFRKGPSLRDMEEKRGTWIAHRQLIAQPDFDESRKAAVAMNV